MRLLSLDTATEACSAALWINGVATQKFEVVGRAHTQKMLPMVHDLMRDAGIAFTDLDGLVCGVGPGSFAGVRIATGFVKGLAMALDKPVVAVSSLAMLAQAQINAGAQQVLCAIDARMDEVYVCTFARDEQGLARTQTDAQVMSADLISANMTEPWYAAGSAWQQYSEALIRAVGNSPVHTDPEALPRAADALQLALPEFLSGKTIDADALAPIYLRNKVALTSAEQQALRDARG